MTNVKDVTDPFFYSFMRNAGYLIFASALIFITIAFFHLIDELLYKLARPRDIAPVRRPVARLVLPFPIAKTSRR